MSFDLRWRLLVPPTRRRPIRGSSLIVSISDGDCWFLRHRYPPRQGRPCERVSISDGDCWFLRLEDALGVPRSYQCFDLRCRLLVPPTPDSSLAPRRRTAVSISDGDCWFLRPGNLPRIGVLSDVSISDGDCWFL